MQTDGGERIEIVARRDAAARAAAHAWAQVGAETPVERFAEQVLGLWLPALFVGGVVFLAADRWLGLADNLAVMPAAFVAVLAAYGMSRWSARATARAQERADPPTRDPVRMGFDARGMHVVCPISEVRLDWAGVSRIELTDAGLFLETAHVVYYVAPESWPDRATMRADADRIEAWWRAATGAPA